MGIALVEGNDLFVENDFVYMKTVKGKLKVDCIYRRLDDTFLDPKVFNKNSLIGVPGLFKSIAGIAPPEVPPLLTPTKKAIADNGGI